MTSKLYFQTEDGRLVEMQKATISQLTTDNTNDTELSKWCIETYRYCVKPLNRAINAIYNLFGLEYKTNIISSYLKTHKGKRGFRK